MDNNLNISFTGEYNNTIDQKNRLSIPAKYRKALSPVNDSTFVLTRGFDQCLILYPLDENIFETRASAPASFCSKIEIICLINSPGGSIKKFQIVMVSHNNYYCNV